MGATTIVATSASAEVVDDTVAGGVDGAKCDVALDAHYIDFGFRHWR
jgi:hypothetical protein